MKNKKILFLIFFITKSIAIYSQKIDEIVLKHIEAIGGKENWTKIKTFRVESIMKSQGAEMHFTYTGVNKKAFRQDISLMGMSGFSIINKKEGWVYMPWQGHTKSEAMTADDISNAQDGLNVQDEFITYKDLGKKIEYFGLDDIDGTECFKIKMTDSTEKEITFYIDPSNYLVIKKTEKTKANGQENEGSSYYSDYKKLPEGILYPMTTSSDWSETETIKIEINPIIDEAIFKPSK